MAPAIARNATRPVLARWGLDEDAVYDSLLVISELVTNAVEHALSPIVLHLRPTVTDGRPGVRIDVVDGGLAPVSGRSAADCPADEHGRGHTIVAALTARSGTRPTRAGAAHWATLDGAGPRRGRPAPRHHGRRAASAGEDEALDGGEVCHGRDKGPPAFRRPVTSPWPRGAAALPRSA
jgi:hypothetical protein